MSDNKLGIGFIGSGFIAKFHLQSFVSVRDADVLGVWSPHHDNAVASAALARSLNVGNARAYDSIADMVADPAIDAIWLLGPNFARIENVKEIVDAIRSGKGTLKAIACEKPLARDVAEAIEVLELVESVGLMHGYLENQVFAPQIETGRSLIWSRGAATTGRPYLARAAEEHNGPHTPWFWRGDMQGGGVLNDMMCHSVELVRHLLTKPGEPRESLTPISINGRIASLKWSRPEYAERLRKTMGSEVDYSRYPSEDFAGVTIEFETDDGTRVIGEASTSWSYVGAGLRLSAELLGPEYSMSWNTLDSGLNLFFSREASSNAGEYLIEKQNAEMGLMPVVASEPAAYGYEAENRHYVNAFLGRVKPMLTFHDGVEVVKLLMAAYQSAEEARTIELPASGIENFKPAVARGAWHG